jgi:hypothetical protein
MPVILLMPVISRAQSVEEVHTAFCSEYYYMHEEDHHQMYIIMLRALNATHMPRGVSNVINTKQILIKFVTETSL